jgi:hypothetical protein
MVRAYSVVHQAYVDSQSSSDEGHDCGSSLGDAVPFWALEYAENHDSEWHQSYKRKYHDASV